MALTIDPARLRGARERKGLSQTQLAKRAGVSPRTVGRLEAEGGTVLASTLELLARAVGVPREQLLDARANAVPAPAHDLRAPTRLEQRAALEKKLGLPRTLETPHGALPIVGPSALQDLLAGYGAYEGERFVAFGLLDAQRALAAHEAALLRTKPGIGARFLLVRELAPGVTFGVTVHTRDAAHTRAVQAMAGNGQLRVVARVVAVPDWREGTPGFAFFLREKPSPWALVVEEALDL